AGVVRRGGSRVMGSEGWLMAGDRMAAGNGVDRSIVECRPACLTRRLRCVTLTFFPAGSMN
ncbi:MAG TPA: hypothetical protein VN153_00990, partial [Tahibacter sp.]|nr:hypothetical protein [Tahibacter sp.]